MSSSVEVTPLKRRAKEREGMVKQMGDDRDESTMQTVQIF
jgi:hypothetical protein